MKYFVLIFSTFLIYSCSKKSLYVLDKNQPIVDLPTDPQYYKTTRALEGSLKKRDKQTGFVFNKKPISKEKFTVFLNDKTLRSIRVTKDSAEIKNYGFSFAEKKQLYIINE